MGFHGLQGTEEGNYPNHPRKLSPPLLSAASEEEPKMALSPGKCHPHRPSRERGSNVDLSKTFELTPHGTWSFGGNDVKGRKTHYSMNLDGCPQSRPDSPDVAPPYSKSLRPHEQSLSPRSLSPDKMSDSGYFTGTGESTPFTNAPESLSLPGKSIVQSLSSTTASVASSNESDQDQGEGGAKLFSPVKEIPLQFFHPSEPPGKSQIGIVPKYWKHPPSMAEGTAETEQGILGTLVHGDEHNIFRAALWSYNKDASFEFSDVAKERTAFSHEQEGQRVQREMRSAVGEYHRSLSHDLHKKLCHYIKIRTQKNTAGIKERHQHEMGAPAVLGQE
ncbi:hypothetical protein BGZ60DRAFT_530358 [Tricladium varicosporioides]|nr:hypothetical protein BGZ60DRAFT_530358 [Hymenoscyphus varicosporioides]